MLSLSLFLSTLLLLYVYSLSFSITPCRLGLRSTFRLKSNNLDRAKNGIKQGIQNIQNGFAQQEMRDTRPKENDATGVVAGAMVGAIVLGPVGALVGASLVYNYFSHHVMLFFDDHSLPSG